MLAATKKRACAESIISQIGAQNPPGRFLIEDTDSSPEAIGVTAMAQLTGVHSNVHPSILKKVWVLVDHDNSIWKVLSWAT